VVTGLDRRDRWPDEQLTTCVVSTGAPSMVVSAAPDGSAAQAIDQSFLIPPRFAENIKQLNICSIRPHLG